MKSLVLCAILASATATLAEDLQVKVTLPVECHRKTQKGDRVSMHYKGTLAATGEKFDASYDRNQPLSFEIGSGQVIKGWEQGLLDMCIGEKRTLTIPPELAYGNRAVGPIPSGSTLVFETELVGIDGVPKPDEIKTKSVGDGVAEKVASAAAEAVDAAKTLVADTDDASGHEEL